MKTKRAPSAIRSGPRPDDRKVRWALYHRGYWWYDRNENMDVPAGFASTESIMADLGLRWPATWDTEKEAKVALRRIMKRDESVRMVFGKGEPKVVPESKIPGYDERVCSSAQCLAMMRAKKATYLRMYRSKRSTDPRPASLPTVGRARVRWALWKGSR